MALVKEAQANGARKAKACELLNLSMRTLIRWEKVVGNSDRRYCAARPQQANQLSYTEKKAILDVINSKAYQDLPPSKIVPLLANEGIYMASESTIYRLLRAEKQLSHRQRSKQPTKRHKPTAYTADGPNQLWSWDISYLPTTVTGLFFYLYLVVDIYSRKIVGWSIHEKQSATFAAALIRQTCADENVTRDQVVLHADNGKPMKGMTMLSMLEFLGVTASFSRPSVSDDNPYSESLFRTVKYHPTFPTQAPFDSIADARVWMESFTQWYNLDHLHSGLKFVTPHQRHTGEATAILARRNQTYLQAKARHPERWSGDTRNWSLTDTVTLNPDKKDKTKMIV